MMKVACVYSIDDYYSTEKPLPSPATIPFGIATIANNLLNAGFATELFVLTEHTNLDATIGKYLRSQKPAIVFCTAVSTQYDYICKIAQYVKNEAPETHVVLGGHHVSLNAESVCKNTLFDAICVGEGDKAAVAYANAINERRNPSNIKNLWIRNRVSGGIEKNESADFIRDLDSLPLLDRKIWKNWIHDTSRMVTILVGRGCPYTCTYCSNHALSKISRGKYVRFRSPENLIVEIEQVLVDFSQTDTIFLEVETLSVDLNYTRDLCIKLQEFNSQREKPIKFGTNVTFNKNIVQNPDFLQLLADAGFTFVNIGLESGSEKVRKEILRRPVYSNTDMKEFCESAKKFNISVNFFVLIGIPGETLSDFHDTIGCVRDCNPDSVMLSIFYPYPGTDLYKKAEEMGLLKTQLKSCAGERKVATLNLPGFSRKQISREFLLFYYKVYKGRKNWLNIFMVTIRTLISMSPEANALYRKLLNSSFLKMLWQRYSGSV